MSEPDGLYIDGEVYKYDDLTFKERRLVDRTLRELNSDLPDYDPEDATLDDMLVTFVYVIKRRANPEFSMDEALGLKQSDLVPPAETNGGGKRARKRPTQAAKAATAS